MATALVYGAYGYTGELVARHAVARGLRPILGGRRREPLVSLAGALGLPWRAFALDDPEALDRALDGVEALLHCAGPFSRTAAPMAEACLRRRVHYLDVTGEIEVFEALAAMDGAARERRVMLLPGAGFDVVPSDDLAVHVAARVPGATQLTLALQALGRASRGTALSALERLGEPGVVRRGGRLTPVPAWATRRLDLGDGPVVGVRIPWGDVATAWYSTGIPDIEVYLVAPPVLATALRAAALAGPVLRTATARRLLAAAVRATVRGPGAEERRRGRSVLWAEARAPDGSRAAARLDTPDAYDLTAHAAVAALERALAGDAPAGFQTPARAWGPDFVLGLPGVARRDL